MNESLKKILTRAAKIHIKNYLKTYKKNFYSEWWLLKDVLINYKYEKHFDKLNSLIKFDLIDEIIENLKSNFSNIQQIKKYEKDYNKNYYNEKIRKGDEMTNKEKALKTAAIKRERSFALVSAAYEKLIKLGKKPTANNIEILIDSKVKKSQITIYLKEIKKQN